MQNTLSELWKFGNRSNLRFVHLEDERKKSSLQQQRDNLDFALRSRKRNENLLKFRKKSLKKAELYALNKEVYILLLYIVTYSTFIQNNQFFHLKNLK